MIVDETTEPSAAPFSQPTIDELRAVADAQTSPSRREFENRIIDVQQADRDAHHAQVNGDTEAETKAIFARCKAKSELYTCLQGRAEAHLDGLTLARLRCPQELQELTELALKPILNKIEVKLNKMQAGIAELADEVYRLKGGVS